MALRTDAFDLGRLRLSPGEGRRLVLHAEPDPLELSGERYSVPARIDATVDVARMTGGGYSLRLRFATGLVGPCMRCLEPAEPTVSVDAREVDRSGGGEELDSPYVNEDILDLHGWVRDALALAVPAQVLCSEGCRGLCPVCGVDLNRAGPEHAHEPASDPRWAKLRTLRLE